jgi:Chitobiase/beta-hexosaminidase C-terminal domain/S-layer homology domain
MKRKVDPGSSPHRSARTRSTRTPAVLGAVAALATGATALAGLGLVAPAVAVQPHAVTTTGLHLAAGAIQDPDGRLWIADAAAGFCRLVEPGAGTSGQIEEPQETQDGTGATCLGGPLAAAGEGPAEPGAPALIDPTPEAVGSGDEVALIPDAATGSSAVVRAVWNPETRLFVQQDTIAISGDDTRPAAVSVGADGHAYVSFRNSSTVQRITDPLSAAPAIEVVANLAASAPVSAAAEDYDGDGRVTVYVSEATGLTSFEAPLPGGAPVATVPSHNVGLPAALVYDHAEHALYAGSADGSGSADKGRDAVHRVDLTEPRYASVAADWAAGYSMVTGLGLSGGDLLVFDDEARLAGSGGQGLMYRAGAEVNGDPTDTTAPVVTATPDGGSHAPGVTVTLTADESSFIRYATDGSKPTMISPIYTGPIQLNRTTKLQFFATDRAGNQSAVQSRDFTLSSMFADVAEDHPFFKEMMWLADTGISTGWPDGTYRPYQPVNRDAMAAFMNRYDGDTDFVPPAQSPFADVATDNQFYREIAWLNAEGISTGWDDRTFRPYQPINRDAMAAFMFRWAGLDKEDYTPPAESPFADVATDNQYYTEIAWLHETGLSTGWNEGEGNKPTFRPYQPMNRDAMATFLYRFNEKGIETVEPD